jgi:hypothetical protein
MLALKIFILLALFLGFIAFMTIACVLIVLLIEWHKELYKMVCSNGANRCRHIRTAIRLNRTKKEICIMNNLIYIARKNAVKTWRSYPKPPKSKLQKPVIKYERKSPPNLIYLLFYIVFGKP